MASLADKINALELTPGEEAALAHLLSAERSPAPDVEGFEQTSNIFVQIKAFNIGMPPTLKLRPPEDHMLVLGDGNAFGSRGRP